LYASWRLTNNSGSARPGHARDIFIRYPVYGIDKEVVLPVAATVFALLLGVGLILLGLHQRRKVRASFSWPYVLGTVVHTSIAQSESGNSEDGYSTSFSPVVHYQYFVPNAWYTGTRIGFSSRSYDRPHKAQAELARYPMNSQVYVFFNPQKPTDSVLAREAPGSNVGLWIGIAITAVVIAAAIASILK
jgi:Protein of unknown function (DUF3592)